MNLEKLTRKAIDSRHLDAETVQKLRRFIDRGSHLSPEEYESLRRLGRAVKSGEVVSDL